MRDGSLTPGCVPGPAEGRPDADAARRASLEDVAEVLEDSAEDHAAEDPAEHVAA